MKRWLIIAVLALLGSAGPVPHGVAATGEQGCAPGDGCLHRVQLRSGAELPYYASYPLSGSETPTGAVVVVHGTGRNAEGYFERMADAASDFGPRAQIVAPWFQTDEDDPAENDAYWTNGEDTSWKIGGGALRPEGLSSFQTVDEILHLLADKSRFPNLTTITLAGHSAGGQFVQRYAAGGRAPSELDGTTVRFVPANPSSYLYLDGKRPDGEGLPGSCPEYNDYKYGLDNRNEYMAAPSEQAIRERYTAREVTYLLGERDVNQDDDLDDSCAARAQGPNRFERGRAYYDAIHRNFPSAPHRLATVPGVGHDSEAMFNSEQGKDAIFRGW